MYLPRLRRIDTVIKTMKQADRDTVVSRFFLTKLLKEGKITLPEIQRSIAGWLGYVKHADSYNLRKSMFYIEG